MEKQAMRTNLSLKEHLVAHVKYPATKAQILTACNNDETPELVLRAAEMQLKDKMYNSADEVLKDLNMEQLHELRQFQPSLTGKGRER